VCPRQNVAGRLSEVKNFPKAVYWHMHSASQMPLYYPTLTEQMMYQGTLTEGEGSVQLTSSLG